MQEVNDNMDELFRRAAEDYPLDTSSKDWNKIAIALQNEQEPVQAVKKDKRGRFLWLLLLLPMVLICNRYVLPGDSDKLKSTAAEKSQPLNSGQPEKEQNKNSSEITNNTEKEKIQTTNALQQESITKNSVQDKNSNPDQTESQITTFNYTNKKIQKNNLRNAIGNRNGSTTKRNQNAIAIEPDELKYDKSQSNQMPDQKTGDLFTKSILQTDPYLFTVKELVPENKNIVQPELKNKTVKQKEKKFYVGLMGGIDITTIRFQKIEDAGYNYGMLLGYQLNKKWSIETGVYQAKKFYYTEGEYFNTSNVWMPSNSKITEVSGNCRMIEIPLTVKYNIAATANKSWFITTGATSYIMQKEDYDYTYYYGNSGNYYTHNRKYDSDSKQFFAAVHLSSGYSRKLNKKTDLRIEPYMKLPIAGMGIGELKFISTGLHLGITRKLF